MTIKPYTFKKQSGRTPRADVNRLPEHKTDTEELTGYVHGLNASDIEERTYRAAKNNGLTDDQIHFQVPFSVSTGLPDEDKQVDFVFDIGIETPVDIDGEIGHSSTADQGKDEVREVLLNEVFSRRGMANLRRLKWWQLETQEQADRIFGELL